MAPLTQQDIALQMVAQLRVLDPSVSVEVGTPERKIIDTVAQALAEAQVDVTVLNGGWDIDSKFGANLDRFLSVFGFARQRAAYATGVIEFGRTVPYTSDIRIPNGTNVAAGVSISSTSLQQVIFATTADAILPAGATTVTAPIRATQPGISGNVAADQIDTFVGSIVFGVTIVTNPAATSGGIDLESDDEFKVRFKNTVFRNLSGTEDMYLGLVVSAATSTKANVVGPISRYREYMQVPPVNDNAAYDVNGDGTVDSGGGRGDEYTTALSTIPYSKHIYDTLPVFVSNGAAAVDQVFYNQDLDFRVNTTNAAEDVGDTLRFETTGIGPSPGNFQPNITFTNVYTGDDDTVQAVRPGQVVLVEHSYMSNASRNDYDRNILNCVDVYMDGFNDVAASVVLPRPISTMIFTSDPTSRFFVDHYRRMDNSERRPRVGNIISPLYFQPVSSVPDTIALGTTTYLLGTHYWGVIDVSANGGTVRSRNGLEWSTLVGGKALGDPLGGPYTGPIITSASPTAVITVDYSYDRNVMDIQTAVEANKQVTTDALVHKAKLRYFKFDITVMYSPGSSTNDVNSAIQQATNSYFNGLYFGSTVQLSDIIQVVHNVTGVDNVRWSRDVDKTLNRCIETDVNGIPLLGAVVELTTYPRTQYFYFTGRPTGGTYTSTDGIVPPTVQAWSNTADIVQIVYRATGIIGGSGTVTGLGTAVSPFLVFYGSHLPSQPLAINTAGLQGDTLINNDFFLQDNELPALPSAATANDTLAGFTIRERAQGTWQRGG